MLKSQSTHKTLVEKWKLYLNICPFNTLAEGILYIFWP